MNVLTEQARQINMISLAGQYSQLTRLTPHEWAGPCPKCGGDDRFHVKADGWFCRQCKPLDPVHGWHDTVDFVRWLHNLSFNEAIDQLTGGAKPQTTQRQPERKRRAPHLLDHNRWQRNTLTIVHSAQERLIEPKGEQGQEFLLRRGLEPRTWLQFGLGYRPNTPIPGTDGKQTAPAILMPWYAGGKLTGLRYRFLETQNGHKQTAEYGSKFANRLFGGHALPEWVSFSNSDGKFERMCDLVICEGEINAMSIGQVAGDTNLHVLSLGSESAKLTDAMVAFAKRYRNVVVWADRAEVARDLRAAIPRSSSITSPGGKDANDLLQEGLLGAVLGMARLRACRDDNSREGLLWDLWDGARGCFGDTGTKQVIRHIADSLGRVAA